MDKRSWRLLYSLVAFGALYSCAGNNGEPSVTSEAKLAAGGMPASAPSMRTDIGKHSQDYDEAAKGKSDTTGREASTRPATVESMADAMPDRFLIKNGTLTVEAGDVRKAADALIASARAVKGYVSDSHETVDSLGSRSVTLQVRIPADRFDASLQDIQKLGKILEKQVTAEDVTEEFVDSQSRLRNLRRTEDRLLAHLSKTGKLSDTLLVEKELTRVRQEIEQLDGRIRFLSHRIAFSTLTVTLKEKAHAQGLVPPETFSSGKVASDASRSLIGFAQGLWTMTIWLGIWAVVWIPAIVLMVIALRKRRTPKPGIGIPT